MENGDILVLNSGSSSIKFAVFNTAMDSKIAGLVEIGPAGCLSVKNLRRNMDIPDHKAGLQTILEHLASQKITPKTLRAVAHRVVHGGPYLVDPIEVTPLMRDQIAACTNLAPLHNPHNLAAIDLMFKLAPNLAQYASFDTAFHASNPRVASQYALPDIPETQGIRRYGFHGLSYASLVKAFPETTGNPVPKRVLAFHLGNGASLCAIKNGKSIATTMGYSPLDGLTMGTRTGGIGAGAVLKLVEDHGLERTREILHSESGLSGLSGGISDMRKLMCDPSPKAAFAIEHFTYWSARHAGSLIAAMQGLDAIAFTGGIGENAAYIRAEILDQFKWLGVEYEPLHNESNAPRLHLENSKVGIWIIPAAEEKMIASDALGLMS